MTEVHASVCTLLLTCAAVPFPAPLSYYYDYYMMLHKGALFVKKLLAFIVAVSGKVCWKTLINLRAAQSEHCNAAVKGSQNCFD